MTREQALDAAMKATRGDWRQVLPEKIAYAIVDTLHNLGLVQFDETKTQEAIRQEMVEQAATEALRPLVACFRNSESRRIECGSLADPEIIVRRLGLCGFKIVRTPTVMTEPTVI